MGVSEGKVVRDGVKKAVGGWARKGLLNHGRPLAFTLSKMEATEEFEAKE